MIPDPDGPVAGTGGRPRRSELDAGGPAARLPLLPRVRPAGLARHDRPGRGHRVPALPEIVLSEVPAGGGTSPWMFQRWLLDAGAADQVFTLTPEQYSPVLTSNGTTWFDYDGDGGTTIRFGDGTFGVSPLPGTVFSVLYRVGGGSVGNVPADTIVNVAPGPAQGSLDQRPAPTRSRPRAARTPRPSRRYATGRRRSSARSRSASCRPRTTWRRRSRCPWVQQAGTTFRWTGSWLTVLTSADPVGSEEPTIAQLESLTELLDQQRLAGYESYVLPPRYVSIDLQITVCAQPAALRQRRAGRRARPAAARAAPRRRGRVLRPLPLELRRAAGVERAARRDPVVPRRRRRVTSSTTASAVSSWTGRRCPTR